MQKYLYLFIIGSALGWTNSATAYLTQIGTGPNQTELVLNFSDGSMYHFSVLFDNPVGSGKDLVDYVEAETALVSHQNEFDFGGGPVFFLDGFEFDGRSNIGFGGGDDWWHYWVRESDTGEWVSPAFGFADRTVSNGSWDGWVYGSALPPVIPEPGSATLWLLGSVLLYGRRRWVS